MVDTSSTGMGLWQPGQDQHISFSHLLHAFAQTDPVPNQIWPINTTILLELIGMPRPTQFSEENWWAICHFAAMGFYYLLRPGEHARSSSRAKDHDTLQHVNPLPPSRLAPPPGWQISTGTPTHSLRQEAL